MEIDIFKNIFKPYKVCVLLEGVQNYHICRFEYSGPLRIEELSKKMAEKANTSA